MGGNPGCRCWLCAPRVCEELKGDRRWRERRARRRPAEKDGLPCPLRVGFNINRTMTTDFRNGGGKINEGPTTLTTNLFFFSPKRQRPFLLLPGNVPHAPPSLCLWTHPCTFLQEGRVREVGQRDVVGRVPTEGRRRAGPGQPRCSHQPSLPGLLKVDVRTSCESQENTSR